MDDYDLKDEGKSYVEIDSTTRLLMSPRNWQLQLKGVAKAKSKVPGKVTWTTTRYYTSLENALKDVVHMKTSQEFFNTATGLLEANTRVVKRITDALLTPVLVPSVSSDK